MRSVVGTVSSAQASRVTSRTFLGLNATALLQMCIRDSYEDVVVGS